MSQSPRGQVVLLALLLLVLAGVVTYQFWGQGPADESAIASNPLAGTAGTTQAEPVTDVRLDLLSERPDAYNPPQRNPFRFYVPPPPPRPRVQAPPPPPPLPPAPIGPPPLPPIRIRYTGYVLRDDGKTLYVFLRDETGAQTTAKAGDIIDGRYRLLSVTPDAVELAYLDGRGRQRIVRSGQ